MLASILRFISRSLLLLGFMLFCLAPSLMSINRNRRLGTKEGRDKGDRNAVRLANRLAWLFGIRVESSGEPQSGSVLMAANHISWLDILALHGACSMAFVAKAEIGNWPVFRFIAATGETIFHQRGNHDSAADVSSLMADRLTNGRAVVIFPEGGILPGSPMRVFHARMFRAVVEAESLVQPVMVRYMRDGRIDEKVSFGAGESMLVNFFRQLARPKSIAEVHFLPVISAVDQPRRTLANNSREAIHTRYWLIP